MDSRLEVRQPEDKLRGLADGEAQLVSEHTLTPGRLPDSGIHRGGTHPKTPPVPGCRNQVQDQNYRQGH
jgi:hypothetical protein